MTADFDTFRLASTTVEAGRNKIYALAGSPQTDEMRKSEEANVVI